MPPHSTIYNKQTMKGLAFTAVSAVVLIFTVSFPKPATSQTCAMLLNSSVTTFSSACNRTQLLGSALSTCVASGPLNTCNCCKQPSAASDVCCTAFVTAGAALYNISTCRNYMISTIGSIPLGMSFTIGNITRDCAPSAAAHITFIGSGLMGLVAMLIWLLL